MRQGWAHMPRLPLRRPMRADMQHWPEWQKHSAPWQKTSVSMLACLVMKRICSRLSSLASTALVRPSSAAASTPARLCKLIWVLAWRGMSGSTARMARIRPRSWMMMPSAPRSEASFAACTAGSISRSFTKVFSVT